MLVPSPVKTDEDVEAMRQIFNECLPFMTKPLTEVSPEQQKKWWAGLPDQVQQYKAFVYRLPDSPEIVAYSLLQWHKDGRVTPVFGIKQGARGHNLARQIIQHYLSEAGGELYGEELSSHAAIIKMNKEAGWQLLREENGVRYLYHPNKKIYPDYTGLVEYWTSEH